MSTAPPLYVYCLSQRQNDIDAELNLVKIRIDNECAMDNDACKKAMAEYDHITKIIGTHRHKDQIRIKKI